jgi:hypothetical protein
MRPLFVFLALLSQRGGERSNGVAPKQNRLARQVGIPSTAVRTKTAEFSKSSESNTANQPRKKNRMKSADVIAAAALPDFDRMAADFDLFLPLIQPVGFGRARAPTQTAGRRKRLGCSLRHW